jgi:DNA-binding transcriptional regulator YdaS (Cro superfamily)
MTNDQVIALLRKRIEQAGSQKAFAIQHELSPAFINDLLQGRREPSAAILHALGLERVVTFRKVS